MECEHKGRRLVAVLANAKSLQTSLYKCDDCGRELQVTENVKHGNSLSEEGLQVASSVRDIVYRRPEYIPPRKEVVRDYSNSACVKCRRRLASSFRVNDSGIVRLCLICVVQYDKENV